MLVAFAGWSFAAILFITIIAILYDVAVRVAALCSRLQSEMKIGEQRQAQSGVVLQLRQPNARVRQPRSSVRTRQPEQRIAA